ncbi:LPXTG cell wall anchor domain-containing protein [Kitasatospora sp. NBC_01250]|uniref:LPXTG cell wall anchor domain-containing protein n=1 Tax=unclassified Kitasatospora TaxID=2633591 RepID=UPI002E10AB65|nr:MULTISPECIES: LPXTG cell wall anchor domain-containing protein [unclassified Kitasatospora]WSJ66993.1 LPXTG cell wall anchor domain-containing protein [Kitasatospora sp. NBC_01302]
MARQARITGRTFAGAAVLAVAATGLLAGSASAHTNSVTETCSSLTVNLANYNANVKNTITVTVDGKTVVDHQAFKSTFAQTFPVDPKHAATVDATVAVVAGDDPTTKEGWTFTKQVQIPVCPPASPSPSPSTSVPSSPSPSPSTSVPSSPSPSPTKPAPTTPAPTTAAPTTPAASPTPTAPAASPTTVAPVSATTPAAPKPSSTSPSLAFTGGGSSAGPIAAAGAAVIALGGGLLFLARRKKAARH